MSRNAEGSPFRTRQADNGDVELVYDPKTRSIRPVQAPRYKLEYDRKTDSLRLVKVPCCETNPDGLDPDDLMKLVLEDLQLGCEGPTPRIILSAELLEFVPCEGGSQPLRGIAWQGERVFTFLPEGRGDYPVLGTLLVTHRSEPVDPTGFGAEQDQVRVWVEAKHACSNSPPGFQVRGFVRQNDAWLQASVTLVPVRRNLFSRATGILETPMLAGKKVMVAGLGSVGSPVVIGLVQMGITQLTLIDDDRLESVNPMRHVAGLSHLGRFKTRVMADLARDKNPYVDVRGHEVKIGWSTVDQVRPWVEQVDLVLCTTGDVESTSVLDFLCITLGKTLIIAGCYRRAHGGQVLRVRPGESCCYECFRRLLPDRAADREIASADRAEAIAYSDRPVPIEPGLGMDIAPVSQMALKLAMTELLPESSTIRAGLREDLSLPLYVWLNRREKATANEKLAPLSGSFSRIQILRWMPVAVPRLADCPVCGDFVGQHNPAEELDRLLAGAQAPLSERVITEERSAP